MSQAGGQATGRCLPEVQHHYVGHFSQKESGPQGPDFSPPKRPAPASTPLVSVKKPKQILSPRAEVGVNKAKANFSPGNLPIGEKAVEQKGRDVPDVRTPACMKAPEVPPLQVRASDQSPRENSREAIKILGGLVRNRLQTPGSCASYNGGTRSLCDAAPTEISGTGDNVPKGSLKWSSLNQSVQELRNKGAIEPAPLSPGFYSRLFLVRKATGEWRPIIESVLPQCLRALPELHYGDASVNPQGPSSGPVVNLPRSERCLLSHRDPPSRQTLPTLLSQRHLLAVHSTAIRVVNQSESIYQNTQTVLAYAHLHRVKLHMYLDDWLLNPGTRQEAHEQTSWLRSCAKS